MKQYRLEEVQVGRLEIRRVLSEGLRLIAKSEVLGKFFRELSTKKNGQVQKLQIPLWNNEEFYMPPQERIPGNWAWSVGQALILNDGNPNMGWMLSTKLETGMDMLFPGMYNEDERQLLVETGQQCMLDLFAKYLQPAGTVVEVTAKVLREEA